LNAGLLAAGLAAIARASSRGNAVAADTVYAEAKAEAA
jgi:hypothetical protein